MKDLRQLLFESCNIMARFSDRCSQSPVTQDSPISYSNNTPCCGWYHGAWQYLRILNCVSSPQWHEEFYKQSFKTAFSNKRKIRILICGTADYSLLYLLTTVLLEHKIEAKIDILDICITPLRICEWFVNNCDSETNNNYQLLNESKEYNRKLIFNDKILVETFKKDIKTFYPADGDGIYDIICSDAFLTRFSITDINIVLDRWAKLLVTGGRIITTVRLYENVDHCSKQSLSKISVNFNKYCSKVMERYEQLSKEEKLNMNLTAEDLRFVSFRYIERMTSNPLGNKENIDELFKKSKLSVTNTESNYCARVDGEIAETFYYQIVAKKR